MRIDESSGTATAGIAERDAGDAHARAQHVRGVAAVERDVLAGVEELRDRHHVLLSSGFVAWGLDRLLTVSYCEFVTIASGRSRRNRPRVGRPPGPAPDPQARRDELLDAAVRTIRRDGPNASMDDIAREAGLTKPILYSTSATRPASPARSPSATSATCSRPSSPRSPTQAEPREMVRAAIDVFIGFVDDDPQVYRFLVRGVSTDERSFIEQHLITEFGLRLAQVLRGALRSAGADSGPAELWAFSILGTVLAGAEWWQARPSMSRADVVDYLTAFVWGGLTAGGVVVIDAQTVFGGEPAGTTGTTGK